MLVVGVAGVHLEESADLPLADATQVLHALIDVLAPRAGGRPVLNDPLWPACRQEDRCISEIEARLAADELVMVRLFAGPSRIRVVAERIPREGSPIRAALNLPRESAEWGPALAELAIQLYPVPLPDPLREKKQVVSEAPDHQPWPWVVFGVGTAGLIVGSGLGLSSADAARDLRNDPMQAALLSSRLERMHDHGLAANVLIGTGAVCAVAGLLWLAFE